jgi:hypothetical protein
LNGRLFPDMYQMRKYLLHRLVSTITVRYNVSQCAYRNFRSGVPLAYLCAWNISEYGGINRASGFFKCAGLYPNMREAARKRKTMGRFRCLCDVFRRGRV